MERERDWRKRWLGDSKEIYKEGGEDIDMIISNVDKYGDRIEDIVEYIGESEYSEGLSKEEYRILIDLMMYIVYKYKWRDEDEEKESRI